MRYFLLWCLLVGYCVAFPRLALKRDNRIVGGSVAKDGSAPYMVSLVNTILGSHFCAGSVLNKRWVLTAAHCAKMFPADRMRVVVGTNHIFENDGTTYNVEKVLVHEKYTGTGIHDNDIALVKVANDIVFTDRVKPIKASTTTMVGGESLRVTGWGLIGGPSIMPPNDMQELMVQSLSDDKCSEAAEVTPTTQVCTFTKKGQGVCMGDSGGPLVHNGEQVGIASFILTDEIGECATGFPDFFTRVSLYTDWIAKHTVV